MTTFNQATLTAFADELEKIGSIDSMEKEAILGRLLGGGLSPKMLAAAKMSQKELANIAAKGGMSKGLVPKGQQLAQSAHKGFGAGKLPQMKPVSVSL